MAHEAARLAHATILCILGEYMGVCILWGEYMGVCILWGEYMGVCILWGEYMGVCILWGEYMGVLKGPGGEGLGYWVGMYV